MYSSQFWALVKKFSIRFTNLEVLKNPRPGWSRRRSQQFSLRCKRQKYTKFSEFYLGAFLPLAERFMSRKCQTSIDYLSPEGTSAIARYVPTNSPSHFYMLGTLPRKMPLLYLCVSICLLAKKLQRLPVSEKGFVFFPILCVPNHAGDTSPVCAYV